MNNYKASLSQNRRDDWTCPCCGSVLVNQSTNMSQNNDDTVRRPAQCVRMMSIDCNTEDTAGFEHGTVVPASRILYPDVILMVHCRTLWPVALCQWPAVPQSSMDSEAGYFPDATCRWLHWRSLIGCWYHGQMIDRWMCTGVHRLQIGDG